MPDFIDYKSLHGHYSATTRTYSVGAHFGALPLAANLDGSAFETSQGRSDQEGMKHRTRKVGVGLNRAVCDLRFEETAAPKRR